MIKKLRVGDWVQVLGKEEVLKTLDEHGELEGMPFMPEMFRFCGQRFQVHKRAHKTCDYSTSYPYHTRRLANTVHLKTRCDGEAHDGCQAGCLLYWKTSWLKRVPPPEGDAATLAQISSGSSNVGTGCTEAAVREHTKVVCLGESPKYICQTTQIRNATEPLAWWDIRQYVEDYTSGNVPLRRVVDALAYSCYYHLCQAGIGLGPAMRWFYNKFHGLWGGTPFPRTSGCIPEGEPTPSQKLNLQPGELVRIKTHAEILKTVDSSNRNRGMYWDAELVPYCGNTYRVLRRVSRLIDEKTANMVEMKTPGIVLDDVVCQARYSPCRMLCPKSMYPYWREVWLERVNPSLPEVRSDLKGAVAVPSSRR